MADNEPLERRTRPSMSQRRNKRNSEKFELREVDGFGPIYCALVRKAFPEDEWREEPYALTRVSGIGFLRADRVARLLGITSGDQERVNAAAEHVLGEAESGGHTCLPIAEFSEQLITLLDTRLEEFEFDGRFVESDGYIGLKQSYEAEAEIAAQVRRLTVRRPPNGQPTNVNGLYNDQKDALKVLWNTNIFVLLGGPGVGKTHLVRRIAESTSGEVALCAPTGKAAKRIEELTGMPAMTIHRLLEPGDKAGSKGFSHGFKFARNRYRPLNADLVIVDETSMVGMRLLADLMIALKPTCRLILVGDPFQLPSVDAGAVLRDLIAEHGTVPHVELTELKRQNPELLIARNCQAIRYERRVIVDNRRASDFVMIECDNPTETQRLIVEMVTERIPRKYGLKPEDIMVIAPLKDKGELSVKALNVALRARLNPDAVNYADVWVGDRVIQRSNNRELDVVNGDTGTVVEADRLTVKVAFDTPPREVEAERSDFHLELAYALTIHKAQGSQAKAVVVVVDPSGPAQFLADAQLTYTAVSRASQICVCIGSRKALNAQVARHRAINRWTRLASMLRVSE